MKLRLASAEDVVAALLLPKPRRGGHDRLADQAVVSAASDVDVRDIDDVSDAAGDDEFTNVDGVGLEATDDAHDDEWFAPRPRAPRRRRATPIADEILPPHADLLSVPAEPEFPPPELDGRGRPDFATQVLRVAQYAAVGAVVLIAAAALLSARFGGGNLHVNPLAFIAWGLGAAVSAMTLAQSASDPVTDVKSHRRTATSGALLVALITCVSGVVASAGGASGPAWILFLPIVIVCGAVAGPLGGLAAGGLAALGIYVSAMLSHTLDVAGLGHLVVILPACPAAGWASGALGRLARSAAAEAAEQRASLERDVQRLGEVLAEVAAGDLTRVPAPGGSADPVATTLAVVFADTMLALRRLVRQMHGVTEQLVSSSGQVAGSADAQAEGVEAQAVAVAETTETIAQLAATAESIAELAERVARYAGSTRLDVEHGMAAVQATGEAMDVIATRVTDLAARSAALRERIGKVGDTTRLIDDLARRTAILSVNASIEAARAGDHGHGFATVAGEVTTLAGRARSATRQIAEILAELEAQAVATAVAGAEGLDAVQTGADRQAEVVTYLKQIARMVDRTTAATREITAASRDQRLASGAVVEAMTLVTSASDRYQHGSRGYAAAARRMTDLVEVLKSTLGRFKVT